MVVNDPAYTFDDWSDYKSFCTLQYAADSIYNEPIVCLGSFADGSWGNVILFQPKIETEYSGHRFFDEWNNIVNDIDESTETVITEPVNIRLREGQILFIAGYIAPWAKGYSPFLLPERSGSSFGFDIFGTYERIDLINPTDASLPRHNNYKAQITIKDIPQGRAAFEISGKGIVIFKDMKIDAKCGDPSHSDDNPDNDYQVCGSIIKLSGGAVVNFMKSHINVGEGYESIFETTNSGVQDFNPFIFTEDYLSERSSAAKTVIWSHSSVTYKFDKPRVLEARDFAYANFESVGVNSGRAPYFSYFWEDHQDFIGTIGIRSAVDCVRYEFNSCVISNLSDFRFNESVPDRIFYIERETGDIKSGGTLTRNDDGTYKLAFTNPKYLNKNDYYIITNNGQHLRVSEFECPAGSEIITSDDGSQTCSAPIGSRFEGGTFVCTDELAVFDSASGRCVCRAETNTALNSSGQCVPKPRYEWANGDESSGQAYPECKGDAFPVNDSTDRSERCQCPDGGYITWSSGGISRCGRISMRYGSVMSIYGLDSSRSSSDGAPAGTPAPRTSTDDLSDDEGEEPTLTDEETCLESGGSWRDRGLLGGTCDYPEVDAGNGVDTDSDQASGGCSLVTTGASQTPVAFIIILGLMILAILKKREEKVH
jgi:hypothetical protein